MQSPFGAVGLGTFTTGASRLIGRCFAASAGDAAQATMIFRMRDE